DRIYTYLFFTTSSILSPNHPARLKILSILSDQLSLQGDAQLANKSFGELSFFTMRFTLDHYFKHSILPCQKTLIVEKARNIIEKSVESENKLSESERTCMYSFHKLMSGIDWDDENMKVNLMFA
ncbi:8804_t:CDS:1, partial [Entrophospora sp. SA101]